MKINQIIITETTAGATASGSVATVSSPLGKTQTRNASIYGDKKVGSLLKGKKTSKPYANSLNEGRMGELDYDLKNMKPADFKKKYGKTREEVLATFRKPDQQKSQQVPVSEADLNEEDKIIAVGKGNKLKPGLLSKPENSLNPTDTVKIDVPLLIRLLEYAREDANSDMDLHDLAEKLVDRSRRGKTLTMKDYEFVVDESMSGGVVAAGGVGEAMDPSKPGPLDNYEFWEARVKHLYPDANFIHEKGYRVDPKTKEKVPGNVMAFSKAANKQVGLYSQIDRIFKIVPPSTTTGSVTKPPVSAPTTPTKSARPQSVLNRVRDKLNNKNVEEGAKVDRMVKHIAKSEREAGKSKKEAENIAWATANKRGYLDNKNKKKGK